MYKNKDIAHIFINNQYFELLQLKASQGVAWVYVRLEKYCFHQQIICMKYRYMLNQDILIAYNGLKISGKVVGNSSTQTQLGNAIGLKWVETKYDTLFYDLFGFHIKLDKKRKDDIIYQNRDLRRHIY